MQNAIKTMILAALAVVPLSSADMSACSASYGADACGCPSCCNHECVIAPATKTIKKTVYDVKCVPVCEHRPAKFLASCDCCPICQLKYKKVLIKREIVVCEMCVYKCEPAVAPCQCPSDKGPSLVPQSASLWSLPARVAVEP